MEPEVSFLSVKGPPKIYILSQLNPIHTFILNLFYNIWWLLQIVKLLVV